MPAPRIPPIPRFAIGSVSLSVALDLLGKTLDSTWTGEEIAADTTVTEPSDEDLEYTAFRRVTGDAANIPSGEIGDAKPSEAQILAALHEKRDIEFAARRRWKAAAIQFMGYLHRGVLMASAIGSDGMRYPVPPHLWEAEHAEDLFDGGCLEVFAGQLVVPRSKQPEYPATILVKRGDLEGLIEAIKGGNTSPTVTDVEPVNPIRTGLAGRPTIIHLIVPELRRRAAAGEIKPTLSAEAAALRDWAINSHPDAPHTTVKTIKNRIRDIYTALVRGPK
jgi:hypothetical protein